MTNQIVTANMLAVGSVTYLTKEGTWSGWVDDARVSGSEAEGAEMLALGKKAVAEGLVVDPYLIDIVLEGGKIKPVRWREQIRANGPPVHPQFGKQAERR
jgi:creatinine amidohydrolase/Fe(II)-dependent formamide hydrolase-like protein